MFVMLLEGDQTRNVHVFSSWEVAKATADKIIEAVQEQVSEKIEVDYHENFYLNAFSEEGNFSLELYSEEPINSTEKWVQDYGWVWGVGRPA